MVVMFFVNDTATTEIYTLSLHDALPICWCPRSGSIAVLVPHPADEVAGALLLERHRLADRRSEEHTSELQSRQYLVCRLLLEKKKISQPAEFAGFVFIGRSA